MHAIPTRSPPIATLEKALKTPAFWAVLTMLEHCAVRDPALIRAIGGCEFEALISDLRLARLERWRRKQRKQRKHWPMVRRDDEPQEDTP
jgi:hypothetical protein